jgi:hypothetical protein
MANDSAARFAALSVTTRFMIPIPVAFAAVRTSLPDGAEITLGSVQVEVGAQRTVIALTATAVDVRNVQPFPCRVRLRS